MAYFPSTTKTLDSLPDVNKPKKLNKLFATDYILKKVRLIPAAEIGNFRTGAFFLAFTFGVAGYYFYRKYLEQKMATSHAYYKLLSLPPLNAGNQFIGSVVHEDMSTYRGTLYYRMPEKEFDILYRMRSAFIRGSFDHDKEILIPKKKDGQEGYDVITPFYYYDLNLPNKDGKKEIRQWDGKETIAFEAHPAALAVHRGWIPASLKDRRLRPHDINGVKETIYGTLKKPKTDVHSFRVPNDPTRNYWKNFSLEDFAIFWELPNVLDAKFVYLQQINFGTIDASPSKDIYPRKASIDEAIVENGKQKHLSLDRYYKTNAIQSTSLSALFLYLFYLAA